MNELALFAGIGGGILGTQLLGHRCVCAVENDTHAQSVLLARQNDGLLPAFPIWDDVTTFDGTPWNGIVDIISGGFPCQDISTSGKRVGLSGERSGLWGEMSRIIGEVQPSIVFIENSPNLTRLGLSKVLVDLAEMGYDAEWGCIGANQVGFLHKRDRIWIVANSKKNESRQSTEWEGWKDPIRGSCDISWDEAKRRIQENWNPIESSMGRVADGVPHRLERLARIGNAQVPAVARLAFEQLTTRIKQPTRT
jgi:DNA (cytosine-5)-methyltransferase 1